MRSRCTGLLPTVDGLRSVYSSATFGQRDGSQRVRVGELSFGLSERSHIWLRPLGHRLGSAQIDTLLFGLCMIADQSSYLLSRQPASKKSTGTAVTVV